MEASKPVLEAFFAERSEGLERVALRARELSNGPEYDEQTTAQFLHGFALIVREAIGGESRDARDLYTSSAAEFLATEGRTVGELARQLVTFGVVLGEELARTSAEGGAEAVTWLARFMGDWTQELVDAVGGGRA